MVDYREQYIASQAPRKKRTHPARSAQALNTSGAGIVHRNMMDLQRQMTSPGYTNNKEDINRLKDLRRDWNRNRKYTGAGMNITGSSTPLEAQDAYVGMSRDLRQGNNPAYTKMYPISGNFMNYADKGGIWGALAGEILGKGRKSAEKIGGQASEKGRGFWGDLQQMGSDILGGIGIGGAVAPEEATEEVLKNYSDSTFGPVNIHEDEFIDTESWTDDRKDVVIPPLDDDYGAFTSLHPFDDSRREAGIKAQYPGRKDVPIPKRPNMYDVAGPWFGTAPLEDVTISEIDEDKKGKNLISDELWESIRDFDPSTIGIPGVHAGEDITVPPWLTNPDLPMPPELLEESVEEVITPFDDSARETGIMNAMRAPYSRNNRSLRFPPRGPHDPFDPNQRIFDDDAEYRAWQRRKRLGY